MHKSTQIKLWILIFFVFLLGALWEFYPLSDAQFRLNHLPIQTKSFLSQKIPLSDQETLLLRGAYAIKRIVALDHEQVFILSAIDGSKNRHSVHDPLYCFIGNGVSIVEKKTIKLSEGSATWLKLKQNDTFAEALFWFSDGEKRYHSTIQYWWNTTLRRLTLGISGPEPVLVLLRSLPNESIPLNELYDNLITPIGL